MSELEFGHRLSVPWQVVAISAVQPQGPVGTVDDVVLEDVLLDDELEDELDDEDELLPVEDVVVGIAGTHADPVASEAAVGHPDPQA